MKKVFEIPMGAILVADKNDHANVYCISSENVKSLDTLFDGNAFKKGLIYREHLIQLYKFKPNSERCGGYEFKAVNYDQIELVFAEQFYFVNFVRSSSNNDNCIVWL